MQKGAFSVLRIVLMLLSFAGIMLFALPMTVRIINIGNLFGLAVCVLIMIYLLFTERIHSAVRSGWSHTGGRIILSVIGILAALGILYCLIISILMFRAAARNPKETPQAMIVLGCKVNGSTPSLMLSRRIQAAYDAMQTYPDITAVVSGGQGHDETISEAQCMADGLIHLGIPSDRIIQEDQSASTSENLRFSRIILEDIGIRGPVLIVTDAYHQFRAQLLADHEQLHETAAATPYTSWYLLPTFWVREWFGIAHAFVFGN